MKLNFQFYNIYIGLFIVLFFIGCKSNVVYEKNMPVLVSGWKMTDTLVYTIEVKDASKLYNLALNIRHRDVFDYMNFYIKFITIAPNNQVKENVISIPLSDDGGTWLGKCSGDICFYRTTILKKFKFEQNGKYIFRINQEMRKESLENLLDIGIRLEESPKKIYNEETE